MGNNCNNNLWISD